MTTLNSKEVATNFAILDDLLRLVVRAFYDAEHVVVTEVFIREHRAYEKFRFVTHPAEYQMKRCLGLFISI